MAATGRIAAAAAQIDSSYSPGGANVHFHLVDRCLVHTSRPQKAEDMLVPPLLRNCLTLNYISLSYSHYLPSRTLVLAIVVHCLGHFKNIYDDDDDDFDRFNRFRKAHECARQTDT